MTIRFFSRVKMAARILVKGELPVRYGFRQVPVITPEEVAEVRTFFPMDKFFIFGHARSGTTLLTRLIRLHPQVHCNYQAHFFTRRPLLKALVDSPEVEAWLARRDNRWNRGRDLSPVALRAVADFILERDARREGKIIVGDKSPNSVLNGQAVEYLHAVYPDAHLIFIVRDGRDALLSQRVQAFIDLPHTLSAEDRRIREQFIRHLEPFMVSRRSLFTARGIRRMAQGWVCNVTETEQRGRELFGERYLSLRYEDLLRQPVVEMRRVWAFLGADVNWPELEQFVSAEMTRNPDAEWQKEKGSQVASALQKGKQGSWRELFTARDRQIFKEIAGKILIDWGYEKDLDW